jgi:heptosyltransferase-2
MPSQSLTLGLTLTAATQLCFVITSNMEWHRSGTTVCHYPEFHPVKETPKYKRIVVRTPTWVGDAVMSLPALTELRRIFPDAHITLTCNPGTADIFIESDLADDVLVTERGGFSIIKNAQVWRRNRFDLAVLFQNAFAAAFTAWFAGVPVRVGYDTDRRGALLTAAVPLPQWKNERHESFYYLNIVAELERDLLGTSSISGSEAHLKLQISDKRKEAARRLIDQAIAHPGKPLAIICPGSVNSRAKRWPAERYAELADRLTESGMNVGLIGSPAEVDVSTDVATRARHQPIILTGKTTVAEAVAIISIADVLITNDTGPAHVGAATGTPTLVIFGPTNPLTTYPLSAAAAIIRHPPDCAPCMLRDCPIDHRCMTAIAPEEVFDRAVALMATRAIHLSG